MIDTKTVLLRLLPQNRAGFRGDLWRGSGGVAPPSANTCRSASIDGLTRESSGRQLSDKSIAWLI